MRPSNLLILMGAFVTAWLLLAVTLPFVVETGGGSYVELFNGATWPTDFTAEGKAGSEARDFAFYGLLSLRTLLNFGCLLAVVPAYLIYLRFAMRSLDDVLRDRDSELTGYLITVLAKLEVALPPSVEQKVHEAIHDYEASAAGKANRDKARKAVLHGQNAHA